MTYKTARLHPQALYLCEDWWRRHGGPGRPAPEPPAGTTAQRLRLVVDAGAAVPSGWRWVKTTRVLRILRAPAPCPDGFAIAPIGPTNPRFAEWIDLHQDIYAATHQDNPPRRVAREEAMGIFAGEDLLPGGGLAGYQDDRMCAISSLRAGDSGAMDLGWTGSRGAGATAHISALIAAALAFAQSLGVESLVAEVDTTDVDLTRACARCECDTMACFQTFETPLTRPDTSA